MTQTNARNLLRTALLCLLLLLCAGGALAESDGNLDVFDEAYMKEHGLVDENGVRLYIQDMDWDGDTCYAYLTDMGILLIFSAAFADRTAFANVTPAFVLLVALAVSGGVA